MEDKGRGRDEKKRIRGVIILNAPTHMLVSFTASSAASYTS